MNPDKIERDRVHRLVDLPNVGPAIKRRSDFAHPTNRKSVGRELAEARKGLGATVFDRLVEIIREHCVGGSQEKDRVALIPD